MRDGRLDPEGAIIQFRGAKGGRKWALVHPEDADAFTFLDMQMNNPTWAIQYVGPDKANPRVLRFTIEDVFSGPSSEHKGLRVGPREMSASLSPARAAAS